jgi:polyhydroxybutyrate depolymerase
MKWAAVAVLTMILAGFSLQSAAWGVRESQAQGDSACSAGADFIAGVNRGSIDSAGGQRSYMIYIPASYDPAAPMPLVFSLHGFASNSAQQMEFSQWNATADQHGLIVVYPQGAGIPPGWNAGRFGEGTGGIIERMASSRPDDVQFITDLIDHLASQYCIDLERVYSSGFSNGAGMSHRLACELSERVAAVGLVGGAYTDLPDGCNPARPVPVIMFHGVLDPISPIDGGDSGGGALIPPPTIAQEWAARNDCAATPETIYDQGEVTAVEYGGCDAPVAFYSIADGGHSWPGGGRQPGEMLIGRVNRDISATEVMWAFFAAHAMPQ